jgi:hypothetical protein
MTQLATFLDPEALSHDGDIVKRAIVSIAIVKGAKNGRLLIAIIDEKERFSREAHQIFTRIGVAVYVGPLSDHDAILRFLSGSASVRGSRPAIGSEFREVTNLPERRIITAAKRGLGILPLDRQTRELLANYQNGSLLSVFMDMIKVQRSKYNVFEEYALTRIVDLDGHGSFAQLQKFRVDLLVASASPLSRPLVVIEFDGKRHSESPGQIRKDSVRDAVLLDAGIPVIRISSRTKFESCPFFALFVEFLISRIVQLIELQIAWVESMGEVHQGLVQGVRKKVDQLRKERGQINITEDQRVEVFSETCEEHHDEIFEKDLDHAVAVHESEQMWRSCTDPAHALRSLGDVQVLKAFTKVKNVAYIDGASVSCEIIMDGERSVLRSPDLFLRISMAREDMDVSTNRDRDIDDVCRDSFLENVISEAAMATTLTLFETRRNAQNQTSQAHSRLGDR